MEKMLADLLQRHRVGLKAEATAITEDADKTNGGTLTAEQDTRIKAITADVGVIDAALAAAQNTETTEAAVVRVRLEAANVAAACVLGGKPEKASEFITAGKTQQQAVALLQAERADGGQNLNPHHGGKPGGKLDAAAIDAGWASAVDKVNARHGLKRG
ncbi:hypothetical protein [Mesorhizobium sp. M7A.F.Ce.TU.012.03.2.1]|uniref:hypothetical protein n=1 Tax=Mesorhizobium sp. M7A.F.Ce.TU.012.03.2.1 TaxID=2493681 RepID=UPI000FD9B6E8|nr:hypothetical protein [Mesorhizobium sp. M7A.F.Ce.TU.012.03.2.1]AZV21462.1 hypothetical protein EJ079_21705 [Mesorhizobium sp. M7A.F.Ce.TU.012.03.2.1]